MNKHTYNVHKRSSAFVILAITLALSLYWLCGNGLTASKGKTELAGKNADSKTDSDLSKHESLDKTASEASPAATINPIKSLGNAPKLSTRNARLRSEFLASIKASSLDEVKREIARLRAVWVNGAKDFTEVVVAELESGFNQATGLPFIVGYEGIAVPTSYRVFLLDILADIDPARAAELSKAVLNDSSNLDEWSVALRNIARESVGKENSFLRQKVAELIRNPAWSAERSRAYLESFDLVPGVKQYELIPDLVRMLSNVEAPLDLQKASWLALERFSIVSGAAFVSYVLDTGLAPSVPPYILANFVSRLDPNKPSDGDILTRYAAAVSSQDKSWKEFVAMFPLHSLPVGPALITGVQPKPLVASAKQDLAALKLVEAWLIREDFQNKHADLLSMQERILENVESAKRGGVIS